MLPTAFNLTPLLSSVGRNKKPVSFHRKQTIFSHGDRSDSIFYVEKGIVKLTMVSPNGREASIGLLDGGNLFGESCLASGRPLRLHTATAVTDMQALQIDRLPIIRALRNNPEFAYAFITYMLKRNEQIQQELANALLNSAEERLAGLLSSLSRLGQSGEAGLVPRLVQQDLANVIGVTRQRVNVLMKLLRESVLMEGRATLKRRVRVERGSYGPDSKRPFKQ